VTAAIYVSDSKNAKIAGANTRVDATYASIAATCPRACPLKDQGCYAQGGRTAMVQRLLDSTVSADVAARHEAAVIDESYMGGPVPRGRMLRLHVAGDCRTNRAASLVSAAIRRWRARGGGAAWTYTHAWRNVKRASWDGVSILASVETVAEAKEALARGYAPARVVASHPNDGRAYDEGGITWIPCVEQTRGVPCSDCGLCMNADALAARGAGIAFAAHGQSTKRVLKVIQ